MRTNLFCWIMVFSCVLGAAAARVGELDALIAPGAKIVKLADGFKFTEGAASDSQGNVFFTDIPNARIHKWSVDGKLSLARENTNQANGLFFDSWGNMIACEGGAGRVTMWDMTKGILTNIAPTYDGKPFNSPNDLWIDPEGGIYFTDPRYGDESNLPQDGQNVYYIRAEKCCIDRVTTDLKKPNGIIGTPDGQRLFVADHGASATYVFDINYGGSVGEKRLFAPQGSDGMELDEKGNVYLTDQDITVYSPEGNKLGVIDVPEVPANLCFGGPDHKTLFITAQTSLYALKMAVRDAY